MGKGKKKDKGKPKEGGDVPSETVEPSTSSTIQGPGSPMDLDPSSPAPVREKPAEEEEEIGLGLGGGRKNKPRKKKPAAASAEQKPPATQSASSNLSQARQGGPTPTPQLAPQQTPPVHPQLTTPGHLSQPAQWATSGPTSAPPGLPPQGVTPGHPPSIRPSQPAQWATSGPTSVPPGLGAPPGHPASIRPGQPAQWATSGPTSVPPGQQSQSTHRGPFSGAGRGRGRGQDVSGQGRQPWPGMETQAHPTQAHPTQAYPTQAHPTQAHPAQAYPTQAYPTQVQPTQVQPTQAQASPPYQEQRQAPIYPSSSQQRPSQTAVSCRYKIPNKILGNTVRSMPVQVLTNYLPMIFKAIKVYRYDVSFKPDKPKRMLKEVFITVKKKMYPNEFMAFDLAKNCYCFQPLKNVPPEGRLSVTAEIKDPNNRVMSFEVSFKATGVVDLGNIKRHMESGGSSLNAPTEEIQCIDVILRQGALEAYVKCGRQFFKRPDRPINLSGGLEMWTGLFQSAIFTSEAFVNIDVAHKGFPIQQSVIAALTNSFRLNTDQPIDSQRSREVENFKTFMKSLRVVATLVGPPNNGQRREFICNGLVDSPKNLFFTCTKDNKEFKMSVFDYFTKEKGYRIKYPNLNCAWVGPREKKIYYPLELLDVAYGQPLNKQLNEMQLATMVKEAATPPDERKRKIDEVARHMNYSQNTFFKKFGLEISNQFLEVNAKVLQPPQLQVGESRPMMPRRGVWQARRLLKPEALESWGFIAIDCDPNASNFENIKRLLMQSGSELGMTVAEPKLKFFNVNMNQLRNVLFSALEKEVNFLFVIVATRGRDTYHRVKQFAERDVGILTQCIKENTAARRMNPQTIKNILLKVNSKLMGINQALDGHSMPRCISNGGVMIVGADVTHPSPDQSNIPSIAAVTASMDPKCFIYNIELSIQTPKKEMIVQFEDMIFDHLVLYRERNRSLPKKIFVFRDGVSEGQFAEVMNSELTSIKRAYERLTRTEKPEILFLLVQKRHHTRFFLKNNSANVEPGTCVDTRIVHPKELDFYLVSHQAIKGTARPTRYHAVCNDGSIPHDEVEQLTYYLCHLYSRCMRAVSYPTPTYYAHLACLRARSLTFGQQFDNKQLERQPQRLRVLDKMLKFSRMFFV